MLLLHCDDRRHAARIRLVFPNGHLLSSDGDWRRFERQAAGASCAIVVFDWLEDESVALLDQVRRSRPLLPLVLVTRKDADNARQLKDVSIAEVVWLERLQEELSPAVQRARARGLLRSAAAELEAAHHLAPALRNALVAAFLCPRPFPSVRALAAHVRRHPSALSRSWRNAVGRESSVRLEDLVDWLVLLFAAARTHPGRRWGAVALAAHVHEDTLERMAQRLAGLPLRELNAARYGGLFARFRADVLAPLLERRENGSDDGARNVLR